MKAKCEQCGKTFSKRTNDLAQSALRMHVGRVHSKTIKTDWKAAAAAKAAKRAARLAAHPANAAALQTDGNGPPVDAIEKKRAYQRLWRQNRAKLARSATQHQPEPVVHFCPRCGLNLQTLSTALAVVART